MIMILFVSEMISVYNIVSYGHSRYKLRERSKNKEKIYEILNIS